MALHTDYCIIGGGPSGLALAWYLAHQGRRVVVVERAATLGGCHRVDRVQGQMTEHGPRIYSSAYINTQMWLQDMGTSWDDHFVEYPYTLSGITRHVLGQLSFREWWVLTQAFMQLPWRETFRDTSMQTFMQTHAFHTESQDLIQRLCLMTDGADADRYTVFEFLQLINQHTWYSFYQPRQPTDKGLFAFIQSKLESLGVIILLNRTVVSWQTSSMVNAIQLHDHSLIFAQSYIFACPPRHLLEFLSHQPIPSQDAFGPLDTLNHWVKATDYTLYISVMAFWDSHIVIPSRVGLLNSPWGITYIVLSESMTFPRGTVISFAITRPDVVSPHTQKNAHAMNEYDLKQEVIRQFMVMIDHPIPSPTQLLVPPGLYKNHDPIHPTWMTQDTAYVLTPQSSPSPLPSQSPMFPNVYSLGTHNHHHTYHFTSMESAVTNAMVMAQSFVGTPYELHIPFDVWTTIQWTLILLLLILVVWVIQRMPPTPSTKAIQHSLNTLKPILSR